ncbi:DUF433 domain-containing protein [Candidatus Uhrbacteria bacterium]|nr:DUF433 domain-containing protein [Candidatus Uhrbacteria bacterium]
MNTNWNKYIITDPEIMTGKPVVKGTRLSIEFILGLFAQGWSESQILANYPNLTHKHILAVFAYATSCMRDEFLYAIPRNN